MSDKDLADLAEGTSPPVPSVADRVAALLEKEDGDTLDALLEKLLERRKKGKTKSSTGGKKKNKEKEKDKEKEKKSKKEKKMVKKMLKRSIDLLSIQQPRVGGTSVTMELEHDAVVTVAPPAPGVGLVYEAPPSTVLSENLARVSLFLLFSMVAFSPIIIGVWVYFMVKGSIIASLLFALVLSSPMWAFGVSESVRRSRIFSSWRSYFSLRVWKDERIERDKNVLFGVFPHGCFPISLVLLVGIADEVFPEWTSPSASMARMSAAVASVFFHIPILAPLLTWLGAHPADPPTVRALVRRGSCYLLPDGIAGVFHSDMEREVVWVQQRKGFVKLAMQEGASLVPVYAFGHTQLHSVVPGPDSFFMRISRKLQLTVMLFFGRFFTPMPHRFPLVVAFGKPIHVEQVENPTSEQVDEVHTKFVAELKDLFNRRKHLAGWHDKELHVM